ncbi:hypothetical protein BGZ88_004429 [Linnemannia elongata]|nr:hypothetical protein BGZ88_004429 [Linnemannia elongata]
MTQEDPPSPPQELVQALRSVDKNLQPSSIPPVNPNNLDYILYVDVHTEPETGKKVVLWEDILQAFGDAVQVRNKAKVASFLKGSDFRTLEPRRIAAMPNIVLDVVVDPLSTIKEGSSLKNTSMEPVSVSLQGGRDEDEDEDEKSDKKDDVDQDSPATPTVRRNPVYGLEEAAMENYSHTDKPVLLPSTRGPQALMDEQSSVQTIFHANQGDKNAQVALGHMYREGKGVPQDYQVAMEWYLKAAEQGGADGQLCVGRLYDDGLGVFRDPLTAMEWYLKAADQGDAKAQGNIGILYENGDGVPKDRTQAKEWYLKAADQGNAGAQYKIGLLYNNYDPWDYAQAMDWYLKAADQGHAGA